MARNKSNKDLDSLKKEDVIQAVVVADNFSDVFVPMTNDTPSVSNSWFNLYIF